MNTISKPQNKTNDKKDNLLQTLVNLGTVLLFFTIVVIIYKLFIKVDYKNLREGFEVNKINLKILLVKQKQILFTNLH